MVALASVGETDYRKLKWFAIHACHIGRASLQASGHQCIGSLGPRI
jgi:hypothetical protein